MGPDSKAILWRTDGTLAGTHPFTDTPLSFGTPVVVSGRVFLLSGSDLYTSDGRPGGTHPVPGFVTPGGGSYPAYFLPSGDHLLFAACSGVSRQIWQTDGTAAGTVALTALPPDEANGCPSWPARLAQGGGQLFFWQGNSRMFRHFQLWRRDSAGNLLKLAEANPSPPDDPGAPQLAVLGDEVWYLGAAPSQLDVRIFRSDGTVPGSRLATELAKINSPFSLVAAGGRLWITGAEGLWVSDGSEAGTRLLPAPNGGIIPAGSSVFVWRHDLDGLLVIWRSDGTLEGTVKLATLDLGQDLAVGRGTLVVGSSLYFVLDTSQGRSLYRVDVSGATLVRQFPGNALNDFDAYPTALGGKVFFFANDPVRGRALWGTDGTPAGTSLVLAPSAGPISNQVGQLLAAGGRLFFDSWDPVHGTELWQSDGTPAGTRLAADIAPGASSSFPTQLTAFGDHLFFAADDNLTGRELWSFPLSGAAGCQPGDTRLCLTGGRFQVEIAWKDFHSKTGVGHAVPLTADTGYFWFFDPANVETVVKIIDARSLNQAFWVFYGALSNVEYTVTVTDTATGLTRRYLNPPGRFASVGDTAGFGPQGAYDAELAPVQAPASSLLPALVSVRTDARAATGICTPGSQRLCLAGGRFAVTAAWKDFQERTGTGTAVPLTPDTGYFWFFSPANVEVVTKVLDGRAVTGKFWFFYGALSNVEYTLTVTDTQTGAVKTYKNPSGQFGSVGDTGAF